jgi:archaeosine synthase
MPKIISRDCLAKAWDGSVPGFEGVTPNVLYSDGKRWPAPDYAEGKIAEPLALNEIVAEDGASYPPYPISAEGLAQPNSSDSGEILMIHGHPDGWPARIRSTRREWLGMAALANAAQLYQSPRELAERLVAFKTHARNRAILYAPGVATPANLGVLAYAGIDLFDDLQCVMAARRGLEQFHGGTAEANGDFSKILEANRLALHTELRHVRNQISTGRLREYAEYKAKSDPRAVELLRYLDTRHFDSVEPFVPVAGPQFQSNSKSGLHRPDVERWRRRIAHRYAKPEGADILLLLPCSARKPYSDSQSHRQFSEAVEASGVSVRVHEVIVTSPLGLVPRELECSYPAKEYDVPVTGDWDADERAMLAKALSGYLKNNSYAAIVAHLGEDLARVIDSAPGAISTGDRPTSRESLEWLAARLAEAAKGLPKPPSWGARRIGELRSLATFQFGDAGKALLAGCDARERQNLLVAFRDKIQVASLSRERGLLSLTLEGGKALAETGEYCVEMENFKPKGNIFSVGVVRADPNIRIGDEVVAVHAGEVRAVGVAQMPGPEMALAPEGEAVRVRHKL